MTRKSKCKQQHRKMNAISRKWINFIYFIGTVQNTATNSSEKKPSLKLLLTALFWVWWDSIVFCWIYCSFQDVGFNEQFESHMALWTGLNASPNYQPNQQFFNSHKMCTLQLLFASLQQVYTHLFASFLPHISPYDYF